MLTRTPPKVYEIYSARNNNLKNDDEVQEQTKVLNCWIYSKLCSRFKKRLAHDGLSINDKARIFVNVVCFLIREIDDIWVQPEK